MLILAHPWLLTLLPLPLLVRWLAPPYAEPRPALRLPVFTTLEELTGRQARTGPAVRRRTRWQTLLAVTIWTLLALALARPQWLEPPVVQTVPTRDLLLAVDLSGSMETEDFVTAAGERVDRLSGVKQVLDEFLTRRDGDRVGLVVFGNSAFVQVPFTQDLDVARAMLHDLAPRMAGPKTAFGDAIGLAITLFERSDVAQRVLIALTDGNDTGSRVPPREAAAIAADRGIVIHTVAIGDPAAAGEEALDEATLKRVAEITGGGYYFAADGDQLEQIYAELDRLGTREVETISYRLVRELYHWPLGIAWSLALVFYVVRALRANRRYRIPRSTTADAGLAGIGSGLP